jgi:hypothetical protein
VYVDCQGEDALVNRNQPSRRVDVPEPCFVRLRTERHGGYLPARIFTRLGVLTAEIDGHEVDVEAVWTAGEIITGEQWMKLVRDRSRAKPF